MAKQKKQKPKTIQAVAKLYFSSLTARKCAFLYTGIADNIYTFILANLEPDKLVKFCDATLATHLVKVHSSEDKELIGKLFKLINLDNSSPRVTRITSLISYLNKKKYKFEECEFFTDELGILYHESDKGNIPISWPLVIFQATQMLLSYNDKLSPMMDKRFDSVKYPITTENEHAINILKVTANVADYLDENGKSVFGEEQVQKFDIHLVDGAETVSSKEILKKYAKPFTYDLVTWAKDGHIDYVCRFSSSDMTVISTRPYVKFYVKMKGKRK